MMIHFEQLASRLILKDVTCSKSRHAVCLDLFECVWILVRVMNVFFCVSQNAFKNDVLAPDLFVV